LDFIPYAGAHQQTLEEVFHPATGKRPTVFGGP